MRVIDAVDKVNNSQKEIVAVKLSDAFGGNISGKVIALWGLAFKPETDDMREAPSLTVIKRLVDAGAKVKAFDPVAMDEAKRRMGDIIEYCPSKYEAARGADALAIMTEWRQFRLPDWAEMKIMKGSIIVDGRNIYNPQDSASTDSCIAA